VGRSATRLILRRRYIIRACAALEAAQAGLHHIEIEGDSDRPRAEHDSLARMRKRLDLWGLRPHRIPTSPGPRGWSPQETHRQFGTTRHTAAPLLE
jgi:hypothetical protein